MQFHYLMNLHYSQTGNMRGLFMIMFHYLMNLHYSQTGNMFSAFA